MLNNISGTCPIMHQAHAPQCIRHIPHKASGTCPTMHQAHSPQIIRHMPHNALHTWQTNIPEFNRHMPTMPQTLVALCLKPCGHALILRNEAQSPQIPKPLALIYVFIWQHGLHLVWWHQREWVGQQLINTYRLQQQLCMYCSPPSVCLSSQLVGGKHNV